VPKALDVVDQLDEGVMARIEAIFEKRPEPEKDWR